MAFAGVSVVVDGKLLEGSTTPTFNAGTASGYHLLVVHSRSRTGNPPEGFIVLCHSFRVGGYNWSIYYHQIDNHPEYAFFTTLQLLDDDNNIAVPANPVKVQLEFSFGDETDKQEPARIRASSIVQFGGVNESKKGNGGFVTKEALKKSTHLKDNCFTIRCDVVVLDPKCNTSSLVEMPPSNMQQDLAGLLLAGEGTDVVFRVGGETFRAHRCILAARSAVFKAALFGPMKEGTSTVVQIDDMDAAVFKALLGFIYGDSLPKDVEEENGDVDMLQHMLVAADRYDLRRLRVMCEKKLGEHIGVSTVTTILAFAEQHGYHGLKEACYEFLRCPANMKAVLATDGFDHLCRSYPPVMKDLIDRMLQAPK